MTFTLRIMAKTMGRMTRITVYESRDGSAVERRCGDPVNMTNEAWVALADRLGVRAEPLTHGPTVRHVVNLPGAPKVEVERVQRAGRP